MRSICIIGGGPTGMRVAEKLSDAHAVSIFEKSNKLGGCWKIEWQKSYFTEHSPRVLSSGYKRFFEKIKDYNLETVPVYNSTATENKLMFANYIYSNCSFLDCLKVLYAITFYDKHDTRTVEEWMEDNHITQRGRNGIKKLCIVIATIPDNLSWVAFCTATRKDSGGVLVNLKSGDAWLKLYERELNKTCNIYKNVEIEKLNTRQNKVTSVRLKSGAVIKADEFILCVPPYQLYKIFEKSLIRLEGWDYNSILKSSYSGIGFQLHFSKKQLFPKKWCNTCMNDWSIIMLHTSDYFDHFSRDPRIKDVYSCTIVDTFSKSTKLNKSANDITNIDEVINEAMRQISEQVGFKPRPTAITVTKGMKRIRGVWQGKDSAFAITPKGPISTKTQFKNLSIVGPHNLDKISVLEGAFESADAFCDEFLKN